MSSLKRVLIMAGGTGGHVFPGLAVADLMRAKGIQVDWLGTANGLEATLVPAHGIPLHIIPIQGVRGKGFLSLLAAPFKILKACFAARSIIRKVKPDVVLGMGGFAAGPGGFVSFLMRKPLVIHEQNAKAGVTNTLLAKIAKRVLLGFPEAFPAGKRVLMVGNPVREDIASLPPPKERFLNRAGPLRLLVVGGSLGATALNDIVPKAIALLPENNRPIVSHQAGKRHLEQCEKNYKNNQVEAKVTAFVEDMAAAYAEADVVICRAGALTVSELCAAGLGAIFVPYPHAVDDHQTLNAMHMVKANAAMCIQQSVLTPEGLSAMLVEFSVDRARALAMAEAAFNLRRIDAAQSVFNVCEEVCQ